MENMENITQQEYAQPINTAPAVQLKTNRSFIKYILLSLVTFGIYGIVSMSGVSSDINLIASKYDGKKTTHFCLLTFVISWLTCGIGVFVWFHKISNRMGAELKRRHIDYDISAGSFWLWNILGSFIIVGPFIYMHKFFKAINLLAADYNVNG